jgi:hypothetical protein
MFQSENVKFPVDGDALDRSHVIYRRVSVFLWPAECFPALHFVKICAPKVKSAPKQGKA